MAQFKTRARALDLLGRQQIAGIPTAINELIKNAHDAYADKFDIDFLRKDNLLILRDDGLGMTKEEFETRWLTIGTESKFANKKTTLPPVDNSKPIRPIMGEKGIGRLAIASIGKQVLIISKAKLRNENYPIVVAFINWELFELPGINLEDITIPVKEFEQLPDKNDIDSIKNEVIASLDKLFQQDIISENDCNRIKNTINDFNTNPHLLDNELVGNFEFSDNKGGTFFYISPVNETLAFDIEGEKDNAEATSIEKMLIGFHNTMTPNHPKPVIDISFRDYKGNDGLYTNIIDKEQFFSSTDFEMADHHFQGTFDKFGQFQGTIKIYGEKIYNDHIVHWRENNFRETNCGAFKINFAYLQGEMKSSRLNTENWVKIKAKGDKFGGLYIYKDNIRVLPYGNSDYDFLDIEKNRSKRASTYFFSYRRMFGAIEISAQDNKDLVEKAGREGFIENKAYRQMQAILKNFFVQLAADFFDGDGKTPQSEFWVTKRNEINIHNLALERRDKLAKGRKDKFLKELDIFFKNLTSGIFNRDIDVIVEDTRKNFSSVVYYNNMDETGQKMIDYEFEARQKINDYKKKISVSAPRGFNISKSARIDFDTYLKEFRILEESILKNAFDEVDSIVAEYTQRLNIEISKRKRLEQSVELIATEATNKNKEKKNETNEVASDVSKKVKELTSELILDLDNQIRTVRDRFKNLSMSDAEDFDLVKERKSMEDEIEMISNRNATVMDRIIRQLEGIYFEKDTDGNIITNDQIADAMSEELEELRDRVQSDIELSQLGLAVGILNHEFNSAVKSIRGSLKDLKAWSDVNQKVEGIYINIKTNFDHLDNYLNLFTPLNRRLNRQKEDISLIEIKNFLIDLFKSRLERHNIRFKHTGGFAAQKIFGFRSTFYPVFVNIIDNAIYWLKQSDVEEKIIRLHADDNSIYISNNGQSIDLRDYEKIFELGFTRKPDGRGMGLNISKEVLNAENYNIYVASPKEGSTVTFKIERNKGDNNE